MTNAMTSCGDVEQRLSDYLEGTLDDREKNAVDAHVAGCARCAALLGDLVSISRAAATLPDLAPSRDLWSAIQSRIETPVLSMSDAPERRESASRPRISWIAAAAALVMLAVGITYSVTKQVIVRQLASAPVAVSAPVSAPAAAQMPPTTGATTPPDARVRDSVSREPAEPGSRRAALAAAKGRGTREAHEPASQVYDREIARLRRIIGERRSELDPVTVAVVEGNLRIIDRAIAQSRAAILRDPASRFLRDQLNHTLDKKLELLRTAVLMPARS
ncbi:MAG: zf-HC2 domain-containing protein [Gemmatimonadota bacterium]|nr:zf-HC2 domain-containing protein [Gemmatimonadota bacterium]